jgi:hypothetical protein
LVLGLACCLAVGAPASAEAQSLIPHPVCLVTGCHEEPKDHGTTQNCPLPATLVCAGSTVVGAVTDMGQAAVGAAGDAVMGGLTKWVANGAAWLLDRAAKLLDRSTKPALGSTWFREQYRTALQLAIALSLVFLLCAVLQAILRQDAAMLARAALFNLPLALLLCFAAVTLVEAGLGVTDWMTTAVLRHFGRDTKSFLDDVAQVLAPAQLAGTPLPSFLLFLGGLLTALATFVVWLELVMREAAIYVAVAFLPLCFASMVWQRTAHWCRRLVELLGAIILAKFVIATALALAAGAMSHASADGGLTALVAGAAVMLIAAFTPWMLLRLVPLAEGASHSGLSRGSATGAVGGVPGAGTASMVARQVAISAVVPVTAGTAAGAAVVAARPAAVPRMPQSPQPQVVSGRDGGGA